jgi:hypothetical protein
VTAIFSRCDMLIVLTSRSAMPPLTFIIQQYAKGWNRRKNHSGLRNSRGLTALSFRASSSGKETSKPEI